jgi:hypothetical protein
MKRIAALTVLGMFAVLSAPVWAESVYHWLDEHGKPVFSDRPPPTAVRALEQRRVYPGRAEQVPAYSVRRVAADFPVTLYVAQDCGAPCAEARQLLSGRGIPFAEQMITTEEDLAAFRAVFGPPDQVPAATIGPRQLRGFAPDPWNRLLDTVGYPREAPPRQ